MKNETQVQHTPGPWTMDAEGRIHGEPLPRSGGAMDAHIVATMTPNHVVSPAESAANARLIIAAPEMLATLRILLREAEGMGRASHINATLDHAARIIAKAEGGAL